MKVRRDASTTGWYLDEKDAKEVSESFREIAAPILSLCYGLYEEPILVDSGRVQPRKRVRYIVHPQRTYQDVQSELAQDLTNLARFTALVRTPEGMHHVKLLKPARGPKAADAQRIVEEVHRQSRERYGRPWDEGGGTLPTDSPQPPDAAGPAGQQAVPEQPEETTGSGKQQAGEQPLRPIRSREPPRTPQEPPMS
jgi:hypothetical protein